MRRPSEDAFYEWDGPLAGHRGRLLRARRVSVAGTVATRAWQLVHTSTGTDGQPVAVSGTVLVPTTPWPGPAPRPVVSYGVGVHGLGRDAAPSHLLAAGRESEITLIDQVLRRGWAVVVTDGEGLGMPGPHTYGAGRVGGRAMLDIVRAATAVHDGPGAAIAPEAPVLLWGYSEGGRCAAWAAELQPDYAPELGLVGFAAGGVPADLYAVARAIDGGPFSGLGFAVLVGLAHAHGDPRLWKILNEPGHAAARVAADLDVVGLVVAHPEPMSTWTVREDPWDEPVWRELLRAERNPGGLPDVPGYLYHAIADEIVPVSLGRDLAAAYRAMDVPVTWAELGSADHLSGGADGAADAVGWLALQLAERQLVGIGAGA